MTYLFYTSVSFDANDSQNADLFLGSLKISLFQKAYACGTGYGGTPCPYHENELCGSYVPGAGVVVYIPDAENYPR